MLNYTLNDWSLGLQDTWVSGFSQVAGPVTPAITLPAAGKSYHCSIHPSMVGVVSAGN